jgi:predicted nucleic acid-binding protein
MIIVDTTIWSRVYRRRKILHENKNIVNELCNILDMEQEVLIGPVRQELLSGIADRDIFDSLKIKLNGFNNYEIQLLDYDLAAEYFNICSSKGIQGSQTDYLICAVANRYNFEIFTEDKDFNYYKKYLPIKLHLSSCARNA